jgi:hypothetical protein
MVNSRTSAKNSRSIKKPTADRTTSTARPRARKGNGSGGADASGSIQPLAQVVGCRSVPTRAISTNPSGQVNAEADTEIAEMRKKLEEMKGQF